jgi:hypothetical protein
MDNITADVNTCSTCRFWHRDQEQYVYGYCHRWPPRAGLTIRAAKAHSYDRIEVSIQTACDPEWPNTSGTDGCGEHQARKP